MRNWRVCYVENFTGLDCFERFTAKCINHAKEVAFERLLSIYGSHDQFTIHNVFENFPGLKCFCCG
jgi:hypothetical protein